MEHSCPHIASIPLKISMPNSGLYKSEVLAVQVKILCQAEFSFQMLSHKAFLLSVKRANWYHGAVSMMTCLECTVASLTHDHSCHVICVSKHLK